MLNINFNGNIEELKECIPELEKSMCFKYCVNGIKVEVTKLEKGGLCISEKDGAYSISYGIIPDFCRALSILINKINNKETGFLLSEERKTERTGIMADVSRNAVLKVETAKDIINRIARMGMNTFMLYMENIYKVKELSYFGYMRGAYSHEELREIDYYAKIFGIEVVPCIQTLGHLYNALLWPEANGIRDTAEVLLVGEKKTYDFIDKLIKSLSECLSSKRIHIGMDEAFGLGTGEYYRRHGDVDKFDIMAEHLSEVSKILKKYGKEPIMWSDMFFTLASKNGNYYDADASLPDEVYEKIPENVSMAYWDYYNEDEATYNMMIKRNKKLGNNVVFFGGLWTWNGVAVNYDKAFRVTVPAIKACRKNNIQDIYATLWGDDGGETSIYTALLGMQLYAEYTYHDDVPEKQLFEMFEICTGYKAELFLLLDADNIPESEEYKKKEIPAKNAVVVSKQMLYQDILQGLFDKQYENIDLKGHYKKLLNKLQNIEIPDDLKELFQYHSQLIKVLYLKCDMGLRLAKNYKKENREGLRKNIEELSELEAEVLDLHEKLSVLWLKNNKAFGLDRLDLRFGGLIARIKRAKSQTEAFLMGETSKIEELEEEKLPFATSEFMHCRYYNIFVSASI